MTRPLETAIPGAAIVLRAALDRVFAELDRVAPRPSIEERAEAIAVALASDRLLVSSPDLFAARLSSVLLKTPEPARHRRFTAAFEAFMPVARARLRLLHALPARFDRAAELGLNLAADQRRALRAAALDNQGLLAISGERFVTAMVAALPGLGTRDHGVIRRAFEPMLEDDELAEAARLIRTPPPPPPPPEKAVLDVAPHGVPPPQTRRRYWLIALAVALVLGALTFAADRYGLIDLSGTEPKRVDPDLTGPVIPRGGDDTRGTLTGPENPTPTLPAGDPVRLVREVTETVFLVLLTADAERRINIDAIVTTVQPLAPPGMTPARLRMHLTQVTGLAPGVTFHIDAARAATIALVLQPLLHPAEATPDLDRADYEVLDEIDWRGFVSGHPGVLPGGRGAPAPDAAAVNAALDDLAREVLNLPVPAAATPVNDLLFGPDTGQIVAGAGRRVIAAHGGLAPGPLPREPGGLLPEWSVIVVAAGLPMLLILLRAATWSRRQRAWFHRRTPDHGITPHYADNLQEALDHAVGSDTRIRAARNLARPVLSVTDRLDAEKTAIATARNGGRFDARFRTARRTPRYLALIITEGPGDHQASRYRELVRAFGRLRTVIDIWHIQHDANACYQFNADGSNGGLGRPGRRIRLEDLHTRLPDRRVLVFGAGDVLLDRATGRPRPWAATLARWPAAALLTPVPPESWDAREAALAPLFEGRMAQANPDGLAAIAAALSDGTAPELAGREAPAPEMLWDADTALLTRPDAPPETVLPELEADLTRWLGGPAGLLWLRAAAVYPRLSWSLTLFLGKHLSHPDEFGTLINPTRFARLAALPWFREGFMPVWARVWLTRGLGPEERTQVVSILCGRLGQAERRPRSSIAESVFVTAAEDQEAEALPLDRDVVFLEMLADTPPVGERMEATEDLAERFAATRRAFRQREGLAVVALAAYAGAALWLAPWPVTTAPVAPGDYLPLMVLTVGLISAPLGFRLIARARERAS